MPTIIYYLTCMAGYLHSFINPKRLKVIFSKGDQQS